MARWNGHADHRMIGVESTNATHSQPANWRPGTIEIATTGIVEHDRHHQARHQVAQLVGLGIGRLRAGTA